MSNKKDKKKQKEKQREEKKREEKKLPRKKKHALAASTDTGAASADPVSTTREYDPTGAIHEAVLAAKERRRPRRFKSPAVKIRLTKPAFSIEQILAWADAHHARTEKWPNSRSGMIDEAPVETWLKVDQALRHGLRGMPGGSSLWELLEKNRAAIKGARRPALSVEKILQWADAFHDRTHRWPTLYSGPIPESPGETWSSVIAAFAQGLRGLPAEMTLAMLLEERRGKRNRLRLPNYTVDTILDWADAYFGREGRWPKADSGPIAEAVGETWNAVDVGLRNGCRGLPGGSSLMRLLAERRGERNKAALPDLTIDDILMWADAHHAEYGYWPKQSSGAIREAPGEVWRNIEASLYHGHRGLPGGDSLARVLNRYRTKRIRTKPPLLDIETILSWADAHFARTGEWPTTTSGAILESTGDTWKAVYLSLYRGRRGLKGNSSLASLLKERRDVVPGSPRQVR